MLIVYGTRFYGKVKACGRSVLATQFVHVYYVPLIPIGTQLLLEENANGSHSGVKTSFSVTSMLAAYLRVWGPIATIAAFFIGLGAIHDVSGDGLAAAVVGVFTSVVILAMLAGTIVGWAVVGKLSSEEKRKRGAYAQHTGYYVDPADMGELRHAFRDGLLSTITERARGLAALGYRVNADPRAAWPHVALDPTHSDDVLLTAAFTLSRIDASLATGSHKLEMEQLNERLWHRIAQSNAPYLSAPS